MLRLKVRKIKFIIYKRWFDEFLLLRAQLKKRNLGL